MEIINKKTEELKPDPNQPRKVINEGQVGNLAKSYKHHGIINPIEIDKDNIIITGEMRWRAAKKVGLKEVPCKVLELDDNTRFLRQLTENMHHYELDQWDLAKAFKKALSAVPTPQTPHTRIDEYKGYHWLAEQIGCSEGYIREHIEMLDPEIVSPEIQKGMKTGEIPYTMIRAIKRSKAMEKDILKGKYSRDEALKEAGFRKLDINQRMILELNNITTSGLIWNPERAKKLVEESKPKQAEQIKTAIKEIVGKWSRILHVFYPE